MGHRRGSSHGSSRIIRKSYSTRYYVEMMKRAFELWHEAEREACSEVVTMTGGLDFVRRNTLIESKLKDAMRSAGVPFEELDAAALRERFKGAFAMPEDSFVCLHSRDAGVVNASKACEMFQCLARSRGADIAENCKVSEIDDRGDEGVLLRTADHGTVRSRKVVVTAGAWAKKLLPPLLGSDLNLSPINTTVVYWRTKSDRDPRLYQAESGAPVFIVYADDNRVLNAYGTPALEYPGLVKFCLHHGPATDPDSRLAVPNLEDFDKLKDLTRTFLPNADASQHASAEACMYTNTDDEDFVLDVLPGKENIVVGAGFSGHGFKFGPLVGEILCSLALGEEPEFSLEPFRVSRFL